MLLRLLLACWSIGFVCAQELTIAQVHAEISSGKLTCRALVNGYLSRIRAFDKTGPAINALIRLNPDAEAEAIELDRRGISGPLHCVPAIVKDNMETAGIVTTNGALAFAAYVPKQDATQVALLRKAGAIVLAKSSMAEWAFSPYETVNSVLPGYTKNPYALDRVTAGSSGGTAAAIAANFGLVGLGSDTGNSIRGPSSHQALVGIRSTMGRTSRAGVFPLNLLADIAGPMTRTVEDAARVFHVIAAHDPKDPASVDRPAEDYVKALDKQALRGARIGVLRQAYERPTTDAEVARIFDRAVADLKKAGAVVVDRVRVEGIEGLKSGFGCGGFKADLNAFLAARAGEVPVASLTEIVKSGGFHPNHRARLETADKGEVLGADSPACEENRKYRATMRTAVLEAMDRQQLDALVYPTWSNPPRLIGDLNTPHGDNSQLFSPATGFPAISVPMGFSREGTLPAGMTLLGRPWAEAKLIGLAYSYEQATQHRRPPASTSTISTLPTADGYRGIWYMNQPTKDEFVYKYSGGFATYPQQQSPIAIYAKAVNKTFFVYGGTIEGKQELLHMISYFDHKTGMVPRPTILLNKKTEDAHDNPVLSIDDAGYLWIFSNSHGEARPSYIHKSRKPYDISGFDLIETSNFSYGHPWFHPGLGFLFLHTLYEDKGRSLYYSTSRYGTTWTKPTLLSRMELGHYQITGHSGDRTATVFNMHPTVGGLNSRTNLYYLETSDLGKTWKTVRGETITPPLRDHAPQALIHDYRSDKLLVYLKNVTFDAQGHPVVLYLTTSSFEPGPKTGPRVWHTAHWTGKEWRIREFARSDHNYDYGALSIDADGMWRVIAPTAPGPIPHSTGGDMELWTSKDEGQNWKKVRQLTRSKGRQHTYARVPVDAHPDFHAFWADGDTLKPSESSLYFSNRDGTAVWRLPTRMDGEFAKPERLK